MNPETTIKFITEAEYETLRGRLEALEVSSAQVWALLLKCVRGENREPIVQESLIGLENRFHRLHPIAQRQALQTLENIVQTALATVRQNPAVIGQRQK